MENQKLVLPLLGDKFPTMTVKTTHGEKTLPIDYAGKWFVLFSHPGDFTPVCTTEFVGFAKKSHLFKEINTELIGLSVDQVFSHIKWIEWINENTDTTIPFPVIADELGKVATTLDMLHEGKGTNTVRAVFIVDPQGYLRLMMYYPQEIGRNVDEVLRAVRALQVSDKNGVATPENYPNNDWIGAKVIIPPAATESAASERKAQAERGEIEMKDWWFAYKSL